MIHFIAEVGVNWTVLSDAVKMIWDASDANCSYVKFQMFNEENIKGPLFDKLKPLILDETSIKILHDEAVKAKIGFIVTPMYLDAVDVAAKYVDFIKIRYRDHTNEELINKALDSGKPLMISVPRPPINVFNPQIIHFYCNPTYPPAPEEFNLDLASICQGFSSHFPHTLFDIAYAINRTHAEAYIEKHVMIDSGPERYLKIDGQNLVADERYHPIDENVSITFSQVQELISQLNILERITRTRI